MGDPKDSLRHVLAGLEWRVEQNESWRELADLFFYIEYIFNNVPHNAASVKRMATAVEAWSSSRGEESEWAIEREDGNFKITLRQAVPSGHIIRGLQGGRATLLPEEVERVESFAAREIFGPAALCAHRVRPNCELDFTEEGNDLLVVKVT